MSQMATMFSCSTPRMSSAARCAVPMTPMFNFSFAERRRGDRLVVWHPVSETPASAIAPLLRNPRLLQPLLVSRRPRPGFVIQARYLSRFMLFPSLLLLRFLRRSHLGNGLAQIIKEKWLGHDRIDTLQ